MKKTGEAVTPGTTESLKARPEFKGLTPEEVVKGKELLEKREKEAAELEKEPEKKGVAAGKIVIGGEEKQLSLFERTRQIGKYQDITLDLRPFGYEFFQEAAIKVVTERKDIPVPLQYVVGPGDEVKILLWGRVNAQYNLIVDRDGKITIPQLGPVPVAGLTFEQMATNLVKLTEQTIGANIDVTMGSLKTIPIFVLGDVKRPGAYTIGSFATITDALLLAGGPNKIGSMRKIQLRRKDRLLTTYDLYDLLLKGDKSKDQILQAGDVIFVPVTGPLAGIAGNVKRPAIYELKDRFDLQHLFELAGGIIPTAYTQQIQIERIVKNEKQIVVDVDDKHLEKAKAFELQDADLVKVFSIVDMNVNAVYLNGNVKRPGKYEYKPGMKVKDLVMVPDDLLPETFYDYALIKRLKPPSLEAELIPFNLGKLLLQEDATQNLELMPQDNVFIFSRWMFRDMPYVRVEGEVRKPGRFDLVENYRVKDAIMAAGDLTRDAYRGPAEIIRVNKEKKFETIKFDVARAMEGDPRDNILLQDQDQIIVHSIWETEYKKFVSVDGEVLKPGTYQYTDKMTVSDLVYRAGNILESAYLHEAEITSMVVREGKVAKFEIKTISLQKALEKDSAHNVCLKPYDRLFVKRIPEWRDLHFAVISGEVNFPGRYSLRKGETLSSLIERAGGYTDKAYLRGAYFTRERVRELQQKSLEEVAQRLERELLAEGAVQVVSSLSPEETQSRKFELEQKHRLIDTMRKLKATGRMTIALTDLPSLKKSGYDIELEDGDSLNIPGKNNVINVVGAVMSPGTILYSEKMRYDNYINATGGYAKYADPANAFVLKVDGSAHRLSRKIISWSDTGSRWEYAGFGGKAKMLEPGDVIVVPEKIDKIAWLREIRDITQILMNAAVVAGVAVNLFD